MEGAVLDVSWGSSSNKVYTAELDKSVKECVFACLSILEGTG